MFYDAFSALIGQSGDALSLRQENPSEDPRFAREGRQISTFLRRTAAVWPDLFATLLAETEVLERGLLECNQVFTAQGRTPLSAPPPYPEKTSAPLDHYRTLNLALDRSIELLAEHASEPWAASALGDLRASLAEAFEIQGKLVDRMLETR